MARTPKMKVEQTEGAPLEGEQLDSMGAEPAVANHDDPQDGDLADAGDDEWEDRQPVAPAAPPPAPAVEESIDFSPEQVVPTAEGYPELRVPRFVAREIGERLGPDRVVARHRIAENHKLVIISTPPVTKFEVAIPLPLE